MYGDAATWTVADHLLANISDSLATLVWFGSEDGATGRNRPKPIRRPGDEAPEAVPEREDADGKKFGTARPLAEIDTILEPFREVVTNGDRAKRSRNKRPAHSGSDKGGKEPARSHDPKGHHPRAAE